MESIQQQLLLLVYRIPWTGRGAGSDNYCPPLLAASSAQRDPEGCECALNQLVGRRPLAVLYA